MSASTKSRRFEARLDPQVDELITEAARVLGISRSEFVVGAARDLANRVLARADVTLMSEAQFDILAESLDSPAEVPRLARAAAEERAYRRA